MQFSELKISSEILKAISDKGYSMPTPIQEQAIPVILDNKDILGCAQTGTGKTAAFAIPIIHNVSQRERNKHIKALIVTPTRELAIQIEESFETYGKYSKIRCTSIFGGVSQVPQIKKLKGGIDVLIATPGRLLDLYAQGFLNLSYLDFFVLDEADRMLDMGFINDVKRILKIIPQKRQSLFFSATMSPEIVKLSEQILNHPAKVSVTPVSSTVEIIDQYLYFVEKNDKNALLKELISRSAEDSTLVFTRTKHGADKIVKFLSRCNIKAEAIHGNKAQNARQKALNNFKSRTTKVLVATDIASRGIDISDLECVINYDIPNIPETYVHRIGRTGRAGQSGVALSFCDKEEKPYIKSIEKLISKKIPVAYL
ncbi:MAG: DEAD/DEAH box helicase [Bacteroidales bacterium]|jgi:ATP-dependent RNA helicase RhlE